MQRILRVLVDRVSTDGICIFVESTGTVMGQWNKVVLQAHATVEVDGWINRQRHELAHVDRKCLETVYNLMRRGGWERKMIHVFVVSSGNLFVETAGLGMIISQWWWWPASNRQSLGWTCRRAVGHSAFSSSSLDTHTTARVNNHLETRFQLKSSAPCRFRIFHLPHFVDPYDLDARRFWSIISIPSMRRHATTSL